MKPRKFQFRTEKARGRFGSFYPNTNIVKLKRMEVGLIDDKQPHKISLSVEKDITESDPCSFKWVKLKAEFKSLEEAKNFLQTNTESIIKQFDLFCTEKRIKVEK